MLLCCSDLCSQAWFTNSICLSCKLAGLSQKMGAKKTSDLIMSPVQVAVFGHLPFLDTPMQTALLKNRSASLIPCLNHCIMRQSKPSHAVLPHPPKLGEWARYQTHETYPLFGYLFEELKKNKKEAPTSWQLQQKIYKNTRIVSLQ